MSNFMRNRTTRLGFDEKRKFELPSEAERNDYLKRLKVPALREMAGELDITGRHRMKKIDLISAIQEAS